MSKNNKKAVSVLAGIVVLVLLAGAALAIFTPFGGEKAASDGGGTSDSAQADRYAELAGLLGVTTVTQKCATVTEDKIVPTNIGAVKPVPPRKWSDSLSTPMRGNKLANLKKAICEDPELGVSVANMFATLNVDGVSLVSVNKWLGGYKDSLQINDLAAEFAPLQDVDHPTVAQTKQAVKMNHEYQALANRLNTLISRFKAVGVKSFVSAKNWHLKGGGLAVGGLPEVGLDSRQDSRRALVFEVTLKNTPCAASRIGFNVGDKRPEVFESGCKPHKSPTRTHVKSHVKKSSHGCTHNCGHVNQTCKYKCGHTTPTCKYNCGGNPPCKYNCGGNPPCKYNCGEHHKPNQTFDQMQNHGPQVQHPQNNSTSGANTGHTPGAGNGSSSSSSGGGTGSAPSGGDSSGGGGSQPNNPPVDTGQGGNNGADDPVVNPD